LLDVEPGPDKAPDEGTSDEPEDQKALQPLGVELEDALAIAEAIEI